MNKTETLRKQHSEAVEYVSYIGKVQHHLKSSGRLHACDVKTEINYQHNPGSTNYWKDPEFDKALAEVIRLNFNYLAEQALEIMKAKVDKSLLDEEQYLRNRLEEIETIKKG